MRKKPIPIGIDDFRKIIEKDYYYVDKSLLIKELIDSGSECTLLPRPRRFGKTLNLSMLQCFFEKTAEDTSGLFRHLAIWRQGEPYVREQGQYPVIFLTFKDVKSRNWEKCAEQLRRVIGEEYRRHRYVLDGGLLNADERAEYAGIIELRAGEVAYENSLKKLSAYLERHYGQKTIILIDEYDTPIQEGFMQGYYDEAIGFMRNMLGAALKGNRSLEKAVLTGILRVARESISGLNNLKVRSLLEPQFSTHFGFLEHEVAEMLAYYEIGTKIEEVRSWYNGYRFGDSVVYNPWSILNFTDSSSLGTLPYWVNTSGDELIRRLFVRGGIQVQEDLACLLRGERIRKPIADTLVYEDIRSSPDALWSFLLFSGYLKAESVSLTEEGSRLVDLAVPNKEVGTVYRKIVLSWFQPPIHAADSQYEKMLEALVAGNIPDFEHNFREIVMVTFSYFDTSHTYPENVYHAFSLGLLVSLRDAYEVKSNRESGFGRYDIILLPRNSRNKGIVLEFKKVNREQGETLEAAADAALKQMEEKRYDTELRERGVRDILYLGIAFDGKLAKVKAK